MAVVITRIYTSPRNPPFSKTHFISELSSTQDLVKVKKMAMLQSLNFCTAISHCSHHPRLLAGLPSGAIQSARSPFNGKPLHIPHSRVATLRQNCKSSRLTIVMVKPTIQFIQGTDEQTIPDVKLTKSRDGTNGVAIFRFDQPSVFDSSTELGDITGFFMIDEEGVLQSVDVSAKFVNGKPARIEAKYIMRTPKDWDRFMRFMERYANENGLQFIKK